MEAVEFIRTIQKMCAGTDCDICPLNNKNGCDVCYAEDPVESVRIVEEWAKEHPEETEQEQKKPEQEQKYIVRADRAGVFFGEIESRTGSEVTMRNVRRIWRWEGANSLSQLAVDGTMAGNRCNFSVEVESMTILGVIEIIPCTAKATKSISEVPEWRF